MAFTLLCLPTLTIHAADADAQGVLAKDVVAELTAAGFPRYFVPARWGGLSDGYAELFAAAAAAAECCASAAWCAVLWAMHGKYAARLPEGGQEEIWGTSPDARISAAVVPPAGSVRPVPGGWSVSGRWEFASGIEHAQWVLLGARRTDAEEIRVCAVPSAELEIERSWNAVGLRASASHGVVARDLFVPDQRSMTFEQMTRALPSAQQPRRHAVPAHLFGGPLLASVALGAARAAVAGWTDAALSGGGALDGAAAQSLARSAGEVAAAGLLLAAAAARADSGPLDEAAAALTWRDAAVGVGILVDGVDRLLRTGGTPARGADGPFHRAWRDVHTVAAHGVLRLGPAAAAYARALPPRTGR